MFNNRAARASLGVLGAGLVACYLGSWAFMWLFTYGILFLLGVALAFTVLGPLGADAVALVAAWHLVKTLGANFKVLRSGP